MPLSLIAGGGLPPTDAVERQMYEALNAERRRQGLLPLAWSPELAGAAGAHSADMAANDFLEHEGSDGSEPWERAGRQGYVVPPPYASWMVIEAISAMPTMDAALDWLLTDGLHRRVLLRPTWREVGIGYSSGGRYGNYWTLDFGCRANVLPVFAEPGNDRKTVELTFANEECAPSGGGASEMGRATEVMISRQRDFKDGSWEPFAPSKSVPRPDSRDLNVRLRDASGRLSAPVRLLLDPSTDTGNATPTATASPTTRAATPTREPRSTPTPTSVSAPTATSTPTVKPTATPTAMPEPTSTDQVGPPASPDDDGGEL